MVAAERYRRRQRPSSADTANTGISIVKPLAGMDEGLEANLRSYFEQDYALFEVLFAVRDANEACTLDASLLRAARSAKASAEARRGAFPA